MNWLNTAMLLVYIIGLLSTIVLMFPSWVKPEMDDEDMMGVGMNMFVCILAGVVWPMLLGFLAIGFFTMKVGKR